MRDEFLSLLFDYAKENANVIILTGDLGYGALDRFFHDLPDQIINLGIAEQSMISIASGLAQEGKKVFVYSITNFVSLRVVEQIRNDLCYHSLDVTILAIGTGLAYGQLGFTHHATEDIAVIRALPNIRIYNPGNRAEISLTFDKLLIEAGPKYIRLDKSGLFHDYPSELKYDYYNEVVGTGKLLILSFGRFTGVIYKSLLDLKIEEDKFKLISFVEIKPLQIDDRLKSIMESSQRILIFEEHNLDGGFGSALIEAMASKSLNINLSKIKRFGLNNLYFSEVGQVDYLIQKTELGNISQTILKNLKHE